VEDPSDEETEARPGTVTRAALADVLGTSPGHFFNLVGVEAALAESGGFQGWRIVSLPSDTPEWLDVRVGDVVTAVNGLRSLERPEDAPRVYEALRVASEVFIELLRDGEERSVRIAILDGERADEPATPDEPAPTETSAEDPN
jgi:hypothetical protein